MNKKRRGFTLLEAVISLSFVSIFVVLVIYVPSYLISTYNEFEKKIEYTESVINVFKSFSKDISAENGEIIANGNELIIGDAKYTFSEDGLHRRTSSNLKLTDANVSYVFDQNEIVIDILGEDENFVSLKYNFDYSSFPNGGDADE